MILRLRQQLSLTILIADRQTGHHPAAGRTTTTPPFGCLIMFLLSVCNNTFFWCHRFQTSNHTVAYSHVLEEVLSH